MPEIRPDNEFIIQITTAEAEEGKQDELLALMTERARFMALQPGLPTNQPRIWAPSRRWCSPACSLSSPSSAQFW